MNNEQIVKALDELHSAVFDLSEIVSCSGMADSLSLSFVPVSVALSEARKAINLIRDEARAAAETER